MAPSWSHGKATCLIGPEDVGRRHQTGLPARFAWEHLRWALWRLLSVCLSCSSPAALTSQRYKAQGPPSATLSPPSWALAGPSHGIPRFQSLCASGQVPGTRTREMPPLPTSLRNGVLCAAADGCGSLGPGRQGAPGKGLFPADRPLSESSCSREGAVRSKLCPGSHGFPSLSLMGTHSLWIRAPIQDISSQDR